MHKTYILQKRRAFTLPEVLLSMALLSIGMISVLLLFPMAARMQASAVNDTAGRAYAESALAALHANANWMRDNNVIVDNQPPLAIALSALPKIPSPTGGYEYRACYWQPTVWAWDTASSSYKYLPSNGHFNVAVFAFIPSYGNSDVSKSFGSVLANPANGLTELNISSLPVDFAQDQVVLVQNTTPPNSSMEVFAAHVVSRSGSTVRLAPALLNLPAGAQVTLIYLPQKAVAVATGSVR